MTKSIDNKPFRDDYLDGMTASEWIQWAKILNWLYGQSQS